MFNIFNRPYYEYNPVKASAASFHHSPNLILIPCNHISSQPSLSDQLTFYYQNVRGLRTKTTEFFLSVQSDCSDIYCLTETWLNDSINDCELFPSSYTVIRSDNLSSLSGKSRGGGVLIAHSHVASLINEPIHFNTPLTDAIFTNLLCRNSKILICVVYISPASPLSEYTKFFDFVNDVLINTLHHKFVLCGDFNIPNFQSSQDKISKLYTNFISLNLLTQYNRIFNKYFKILDLVMCNTEVVVERHFNPLVSEDAYHPVLTWSLDILSSKLDKPRVQRSSLSYDYSKANFYSLYNDLSNSSFAEVLNETNVDTATNLFYQVIYSVMDCSIPRKQQSFDPKYPNWYTSRLIKKIKLKNKIYKKLKSKKGKNITRGLSLLDQKFKTLRKEVKFELNSAYQKHAHATEQLIKTDPKRIWRFTNDRLNRKPSFPNEIIFDNKCYDDSQEIATKFANYFESVFVDDNFQSLNNSLCFKSSNKVSQCLSYQPITEEEIRLAIQKLKPSKCCGADQIPAFIVKGCVDTIVKPLLHIYNLCLQFSTFPSIWKVSKVIPLFKKGDRRLGKNYRPISLINTFSKIIESILHDRIYFLVRTSLSKFQHGFMRGRSTVTNLSVFTNYVYKNLSSNVQVDSVYFDFQTAFDKVDHDLLCLKLAKMNIPPYLVLLLQSYLKNRFQFVNFNGFSSQRYRIGSGVPQGSNLGPILFNIFINDVVDVIKTSNILLYADDMKLFYRIGDLSDCTLLQNDITAIERWSIRNKMSFNTEKCVVVSFYKTAHKISSNYHLNDVFLKNNSNVKDMGINFDSQLTFKEHINAMVNCSLKSLGGIIRISRHFREISTLKLLYNALVRSKLEYCSIIWNPILDGSSDQIERVQKRFLRFLYLKENGTYPHYFNNFIRSRDLQLQFDLLSLKLRRKVADALFIFKLLNSVIDSSCLLNELSFKVQPVNTRNVTCFQLPRMKNNHSKSSPVNRLMHLFNTLPVDADPFFFISESIQTKNFNFFHKQLLNVCFVL